MLKKQYHNRWQMSLRIFALLWATIYSAVGLAQSPAPLPTCNTPTFLTVSGTNTVPATIVTGSSWTGATGLAVLSNQANVVDASTTNFATFTPVALSTIRLTVENTGGYFEAGSFAGFDIAPVGGLLNLSLLGTTTIKTYLGTTLQEEFPLNSDLVGLTLLDASGKQRAGFKTSQNFDRIMIEQVTGLSLLGGLQVYNAVVERYCAGPTPACNTNVALTKPSFPVYTDAGTVALLALNSTITAPENAIDADPANYATISQTLGLGATAEFEVHDALGMYSNTFAGFDIENPNLLDLGVLSNISVSVYRNDTLVETSSGDNLLALNTGLLAGSGRRIIGFVPSGAFNSIRLTLDQTASVSLGSTLVYGAIVKQFCANEIDCSGAPALNNTGNPDYPVYVNARRTGITGTGCVACAVGNPENLIDGNSNTFATIDLTAGVLSTGSIAVVNQLQDYPAGSFAGFEIESATLLSADILGAINFKLYRNDTLVQDGTGQALLAGVGTDILTGGSSPKQIVGVISDVAFDEVQMEVSNLLAANVLGTIQVYETYIETSCARNVDCQTSEVLTTTQHGAVINGENTGVSGAICAACKVDDPWNAVSASTTDFSRLYNTVNALSTTAMSVAVPQYEYPAGTFAGFVIKRNSFLISTSLFPSITISTYMNGVLQETQTGSNLLNLAVLIPLVSSDTNVYNAGFVTTMPFDEVKIEVNNLLSGLDQYIDVYGAFVDTRFVPAGTSGMACNLTKPDLNVGYINRDITGDASTNDITTVSTTYGTAVADMGNPTTTVPVVNTDGTYTFNTDTIGVYQFLIPVCDNGVCTDELLTITVKDPAVRSSVPVANTDLATVKMDQSIVIAALENDYAGTGGSALVPGSMTLTDLNGTAAGNTTQGGTAVVNVANGEVTYTPVEGFIGIDTIYYTVCDNQVPAQCASAYQIVYVVPATYANSTLAADDYIQTYRNKAVSGNVQANDMDPDGDLQTVTTQNVNITNKGTFVLNADGSFTFTPVTGFIGSVELAYTTCDDGTPSVCANATAYILVTPEPQTVPDVNVGLINTPVPGNVSTNDVVPVGTTYGTPALANAPVGSTPSMNLNADGSYTFQADTKGVYTYDIPVCVPDQGAPCPTERLTITVINQMILTNTPVVNDDIVTTANNTAVTYDVGLNDGPSNDANVLGLPTIATAPANGVAVVNADSTITYTPNPGFTGTDTLLYQVCETPSTECGTARMIVTVLPADAYNTITPVDDYVSTPKGVAASGNVLDNDIDAEGNTLTVLAQNITIPGQGTFVLNTDGSFTFTPVAGFLGTVDLAYTAMDDGEPALSGGATLHILVREGNPDLTLISAVATGTFFPASATATRYILTTGEVIGYSTKTAMTPVYVRVFKIPSMNYTFDPLATTVGGAAVNNQDWEIVTNTSGSILFKLKDGIDIPAYGISRLGLMVEVQGTATYGVKLQNAVIINGSGGDMNNDNNSNFRSFNVQ